MTLRRIVVAVLLAVAVARAAAAQAPALTPPRAEADAAILSTVVRESGVERDVRKPGWSEYVPVIVTAGFRWFWDQLRPLRSLFRLAPGAGVIVAWVFVALVALVVAAFAVRLLFLFRRSRGGAPSGDVGSASAFPWPSPAGPAEWLRELDRRLGAGDVAGALEAVWWFLARSVSSDEVHPSWTSGELLTRARRHELRPFALQLDRFRYGPRGPSPSEVRDLALRLEQALA